MVNLKNSTSNDTKNKSKNYPLNPTDKSNSVFGFFLLFLFPALIAYINVILAILYQKKWGLNFLLPILKNSFNNTDDITRETLTFLILGLLYLNVYLLSPFLNKLSTTFLRSGINGDHYRLSLRLSGNLQNNVENAPLMLAAVVIPYLTKLDEQVHLNFLTLLLFSR
ncbi:hypothetical protein HDU92_001781 [Lobulomyces angularis]|nr:hypothetical protein HDU92_001781 [Lobulomyces angularis]